MMPVNRHRIWQLLADAALIALAWWLAFWLRFDHGVPGPYHRLFVDTIAVVVAIKLAVFIVFGFYNRWWRYVSTRDMWGAARGVTVACIIADLVIYFAHPIKGFPLPRSIAVLDWLFLLAFVAGTRLIARSLIERPGAASLVARGKEVIVVGAGDAAQLVIREMLKSPALGYTAHAAPIQMVFYAGTQFPAAYRNDAFVAMHGSWNRDPPAGYEVVRIRFEDGRPVAFEPFVRGFLIEEGRATFGRPTGIAVARDGALLVGDDTTGVVYRITYAP